MSLLEQFFTMMLLALPISCVAWTVTHEEVVREPREYFVKLSKHAKHWWQRKFFYLFTCEYCFSHYVTAATLFITRFTLIYPDWRGTILAFFAIVWIANVYMSLFGRLRLDIKHEREEIAVVEKELKGSGRGTSRKTGS